MSELSTITRPLSPSGPPPTPVHIHSPKPISSCAVGFLSLYSLDEESCPKLDELGLKSPSIQTPDIDRAITLAALVKASVPEEPSISKSNPLAAKFLPNQAYPTMQEFIHLPPFLAPNNLESTPAEKEMSSLLHAIPPAQRQYNIAALWPAATFFAPKLLPSKNFNHLESHIPNPIGYELGNRVQIQHQLKISNNRLAAFERDRVLNRDVNTLYQYWDREFGMSV
ncbi:hypothetical protein TWF694_000405 [Orbilia ellipsospora]|uniref:Uncharacterized protein n=1 Tax=Orbilia ellipsospora TaxID=2528407 RepID=A0AAV9XRV8_9PEZI